MSIAVEKRNLTAKQVGEQIVATFLARRKLSGGNF